MALIGTIRKNGWILIALMVLALGGFLLMEFMSNSQRNTQGDINTLARVNGKEIKRSDFENYQNIIYGNAQQDPFQVRSDVWNFFLEKSIVEQEAEKMGLGIGKEELTDLQFGTNLSPVVVQRFSDPNTRQVQRSTLQSVKTQIDEGTFTDERNRVYWKTMVEEIIKDRKQTKIINLISKGLYTPSWQAEMVFRENNERVDFRYVRIGYDKVTDEEAKPTDDDYKAFLKENPRLFDKQEETRIVDYVTIDVVPTAADNDFARGMVDTLVGGFRTIRPMLPCITALLKTPTRPKPRCHLSWPIPCCASLWVQLLAHTWTATCGTLSKSSTAKYCPILCVHATSSSQAHKTRLLKKQSIA